MYKALGTVSLSATNLKSAYFVPGSKEKSTYLPISASNSDPDEVNGLAGNGFIQSAPSWGITLIISFILLSIAFTGFVLGIIADRNGASTINSHSVFTVERSEPCEEPHIRREWRDLSIAERDDYIAAVKCLSTLPSALDFNGTVYDDFSWIHRHIGLLSHKSAAFLAWHRYYLHVYESVLQDQCGYTGHLTYWDWTLDWEDITGSVVWDAHHGFGGNGDLSLKPSVNYGRCIKDGPFANVEVLFKDGDIEPHCISRGFTASFLEYSGEGIRPTIIDALLEEKDYESFWESLEKGVHAVVPNLVRGDFWLFTAPNDPVFFLHHVMLDRLWWLWQQRDLQARLTDFGGAARNGSLDAGSLHDYLQMVGYAESVQVSKVMNTESDLLCYRY